MDGSVCAAKHEEQNYAAGVMSLNVPAALRCGGISAPKFNRITAVEPCTNAS
ncbi:MAG: hypothetical protein LC115_01235 [Bacteroidia bacterium]|nr:hypothetical protein [Bacteroidia bacterium]